MPSMEYDFTAISALHAVAAPKNFYLLSTRRTKVVRAALWRELYSWFEGPARVRVWTFDSVSLSIRAVSAIETAAILFLSNFDRSRSEHTRH